MPADSLCQLIEVEHGSRRRLDNELEDGSSETCGSAGVRLLTERMTAAFERSGEETVGFEPGFRDQPPAMCGIATKPFVVIVGRQQDSGARRSHELGGGGALDHERSVSKVRAQTPSQCRQIPVRQSATAKQLVWLSLQAMREQLDVMQHCERSTSCSTINKIRVTMITAQYRGIGGYRLGTELSGSQPPCHLSRNDH